jgi:hypothetical protein
MKDSTQQLMLNAEETLNAAGYFSRKAFSFASSSIC